MIFDEETTFIVTYVCKQVRACDLQHKYRSTEKQQVSLSRAL